MTWVERRWDSDPGVMGGRKARQSFTYRAFRPDPIASSRIEGIEPSQRNLAQALIDPRANRAVRLP